MNQRIRIKRFVLCALMLALPAAAQDDPVNRSGVLATRSSPFDPPAEDVFVADDGAGLDTGCTFNTDSNHPLRIDIMIDQAVGAVDGNGFLVDPAGLVADGVIPATVDVIMPAFDVDYNGAPPPERDEVFLNGERLGLLTGDNQIWKLNSFSIPVSKIKFPAPAANGSPAPVANRVQINVDTLSTGRWCTAIDWVALVIPVKLKIALKLEPTGGNEIRVRDYGSNETIDTIYEQSFDASCRVKTDIGPYDEYPFSGPARKLFGFLRGSARLHTTLQRCPRNDHLEPEVKVDWEIAGTSLKGVAAWEGNEGDVDLTMPEAVGSYDVALTFTIDGKKQPAIHRKLFVTKGTPLSQVDPPHLGWYEKATDWASGQSEEGAVLSGLLGGLYSFGQSNWRYGYRFGAKVKCAWDELVADQIQCDYADCYVFSEVFENMAATLGVGGLSLEEPDGTHGMGFLTSGAPALDPLFTGNARRLGSSTYDRYRFTSHSLRRKSSKYYDATFNGIYSSPTAFITANVSEDDDGILKTEEGWTLYELGGSAYDSWGSYAYEPPVPGQASLSAPRSSTADVAFTGNATFHPVDENLDGIAEALTAGVEVRVNSAGQYTIRGTLQKNGELIANRPSWESMLPVRATLDEIPGTYTITLELSGEQIYRAGVDGPYDLVLQGIASNGAVSATIATPGYAHTLFGENPAGLTSVSEAAVDANGDGKHDFIEVTFGVGVRQAGRFKLQGSLAKDGQSIADAGTTEDLQIGARQVSLRFDGRKIRSSGLDGPYEGNINLIDAGGHTLDGIRFTTRPYTASSFSSVLAPRAPFSDQGVDTNGNGLYDLLRITFGAESEEAGGYLLTGVLRGAGSTLAVYADSLQTLPAGPASLRLDFPGPAINALGLDGPYTVDVLIRDPRTLKEIDAIRLPQGTAAYQASRFDAFGSSNLAIALTGNSSDSGVDTDSDNLFDELHVDVGVRLARADFYEWSARLVDGNGAEIGFYSNRATLGAGVNNLRFVFDGEAIGRNGAHGPYFLKGLLIFGNSGANLVSVDVAATRPYRVTEFEGVVDLQGPRMVVTEELSALEPINRKYKVVAVKDFILEAFDQLDPEVSLDDVVITRVTSDEADDAPGLDDGTTADDIVIAADCRSVELRAERVGLLHGGGGNGRVYTIHVAAADHAGNVGSASHAVIVPSDSTGREAVDDGPAHTVEGCAPVR